MEQHKKGMEYCTYCPKLCRHVCPVSNATGRETLIPQAKMELFNMLRRKAVPWERDYTEPLYGCTSCRLCTEYCVHGVAVADALLVAREKAERMGLAHPALARLPQEVRDRNRRLRDDLHREFSHHLFAEEAQVGFFPGCETIEGFLGDVRDAFALFDHLNLNFIRLVDSPTVCAGYPLWAAGHRDAARFWARDVVRAVRRFNTIISPSPTTVWLLREKLPAEGFEHDTEVLHLSEYLYVHTERLDVRRRRAAAFYHDPCYLGRYLGVYDPPRRLLSRCVDQPKEFFYSREEAECCGGGGLVPQTFPEAAATQAKRRLSEAELFEVDLVVTACATCKRMLARQNPEVEVLDLVNLLAWAIHDPDRRALEH